MIRVGISGSAAAAAAAAAWAAVTPGRCPLQGRDPVTAVTVTVRDREDCKPDSVTVRLLGLGCQWRP
jgi:hypothetical protein